MAYMKAGMIESVQGVRYLGRPKDEASMGYGRSEVRRRAEEVFHSYVDGKPMHELSRVCDQMEADFIREHSAMIDRIAEERERQGLTPLQEVSHLNENFDNARDDGKKDHADAKEILHTDQRGKAISRLKEMLAPERVDELRTIVDHYQQKLRDYQELSRTDPILACCRIVVQNCKRTERGVIGRTNDGAEFGLTENGRPLFGNDCPP